MDVLSPRFGAPARRWFATAVVLLTFITALVALPARPAAAFGTEIVTISGDPVTSVQLCATVSWPTDGLSQYRWLLDGQPTAATGRCYTRDPLNDTGKALSVQAEETSRNFGYHAGSSAAFGPLGTRVETVPVVLVGQPDAGHELWPEFLGYNRPTTKPTALPISYTYAWTRDGAPIPGATEARYTVQAADRGRRLGVIVTMGTVGSSAPVTASILVPATRRAAGFNGDGTADLFARTAAGDLVLYPGDGRGGWLAPQTIGRGWGGFDTLLAPGDFDGDGAADVIARDAAGRLFLYQGNGQGGWKGAWQIGQGWGGFNALVAPGDFNGDGTNDLIARDTAGQLWLYPGNGRGGWLGARVIGTGWGSLSGLTSPGDFDGDFAPDVLGIAYDYGFGHLKLYGGSGAGGFGARQGSYIGDGWWGLRFVGGPGDFNGDGDADVFSVNAAGDLTMYWGIGSMHARYGDAGGDWRNPSSSVAGWGWGGFTAVF
ncbi:FG-GAP-like repeat-containing protein [Sinomonas sp. R1AF57]|uniref:FG-GAP-like repeat-containing protein n=1 Tax=Sinomonas sp. R1AF57 TaxID=2020377 RepID=UPI000B5FC203|nr:FG-GAP-like repeat-containing protein [Sinomonas sp. R1AF57]ASN52577.1 hypothetical protein CGQ25_11230 [Sinomonas sp. R1AF57]